MRKEMKYEQIISVFKLSALGLAFVICFTSCEKDSEKTTDTTTTTEPTYEFLNQNLQGKIDENAWEFNTGIAYVDPWDSTLYAVELYADTNYFPCIYMTDINQPYIWFSIKPEVGIYELDLSNYISIYALNNTTYMGNKGAIEILSIDSTTIAVRMDASDSEGNYINGNFTINLCE